MSIRVFWDMDGTLAKWRSSATFSDLYKKGYFASLEPETALCKLANKLFKRSELENYTYVISAGIESCDSIMKDEASKRFQSEEDCRKFVYQLLTEVCEKNGVSHNEISDDSSLDELEEFANDNLPGDDFLNVYKYDLL